MRWIVVLLAVVFCMDAYGQDCSSVIALSKTINTVVSDKSEVEQNAAEFCNEYSRHRGESSTYNYGAGFKFLSASFGGGNASVDEVASKYCSASDRSRATSNAFKQYIESIAPEAYSAYEQCLRLTDKDVKFNVNVGSVLPTEFSLTASFRSSTGQTSTTIDYSSSQDVTCKWDGQIGNRKIINNGTSSILKCNRGDQSRRSFVEVVWTGGGGVTLTLPWQAYNSSGIPVDSLTTLQQVVAGLRSQVNGLSANFGRIRFEYGSIGMKAVNTRPLHDSSQCPNGEAGLRGELFGRVPFSSPFASIPTVTVGLSQLDIEGNKNNRISVKVIGVDSTGFNYSFTTHCDTQIHSATANWIAVAK